MRTRAFTMRVHPEDAERCKAYLFRMKEIRGYRYKAADMFREMLDLFAERHGLRARVVFA